MRSHPIRARRFLLVPVAVLALLAGGCIVVDGSTKARPSASATPTKTRVTVRR